MVYTPPSLETIGLTVGFNMLYHITLRWYPKSSMHHVNTFSTVPTPNLFHFCACEKQDCDWFSWPPLPCSKHRTWCGRWLQDEHEKFQVEGTTYIDDGYWQSVIDDYWWLLIDEFNPSQIHETQVQSATNTTKQTHRDKSVWHHQFSFIVNGLYRGHR